MSPRFSFRPPATLSDRRLAELAAGGDERAFEVLLRRHRRELERYCRRLDLGEDRAEDVLQQAFTRAWVALRRGSDVGQPRAWLFRIVHNAALNAHRSARLRDHQSIDAIAPGALAPRAVEDLETRLLARDALREVAALPEMQREAVVMTAIEGRSHEEAAGVLGISDGAVRGLVHRARTRLRAAAAALTPQGLWELLSHAPVGGASEAGAGAGLAGLLGKGVALTAVTGLLAGGAVVQLERGVRHPARAHRSDSAPLPHAARAQPRGSALAAVVPSSTHLVRAVREGRGSGLRAEAHRRGPDRSRGRGQDRLRALDRHTHAGGGSDRRGGGTEGMPEATNGFARRSGGDGGGSDGVSTPRTTDRSSGGSDATSGGEPSGESGSGSGPGSGSGDMQPPEGVDSSGGGGDGAATAPATSVIADQAERSPG